MGSEYIDTAVTARSAPSAEFQAINIGIRNFLAHHFHMENNYVLAK